MITQVEIAVAVHRTFDGSDGKKPVVTVMPIEVVPYWPHHTFYAFKWVKIVLVFPMYHGQPRIASSIELHRQPARPDEIPGDMEGGFIGDHLRSRM